MNISMTEDKLKELLQKYYEGKSTSEEEYSLRVFFSENTNFPGYEAEKEIFRHYSESERMPVPSSGFEMKIVNAVDNVGKRLIRRVYITVLSSAAAILIMISTWFVFLREKEPADTFSDPGIAYAETMKILYKVSSQLNRGTDAFKAVNTMTGTTLDRIRTIDKSLSAIDKGLQKAGISLERSGNDIKYDKNK